MHLLRWLSSSLRHRARARMWRREPPLWPPASLCLFPDRALLFRFGQPRREALQIYFGGYDVAHLLLQFVDRYGAIQDHEVVGIHHLVVFLKDARLEQAKAFGAVVRQSQIHARFVVFQFWASAQDALHANLHLRATTQHDLRNLHEPINLSPPPRNP